MELAQQEPTIPNRLKELNHGQVLWALASGIRSDLDSDLRSLLQRTGASHLLAVSGLHIGIVAGMAWWVARFFAAPLVFAAFGAGIELWSSTAACAAAILYGQAVSWVPSAQRAVGMVGIASILGPGM